MKVGDKLDIRRVGDFDVVYTHYLYSINKTVMYKGLVVIKDETLWVRGINDKETEELVEFYIKDLKSNEESFIDSFKERGDHVSTWEDSREIAEYLIPSFIIDPPHEASIGLEIARIKALIREETIINDLKIYKE